MLIFTGIHPQGSLGVVKLLSDRIDDLYREVGTANFSALICTEYDPVSHEPTHVEILTPLYRMEDQ